MSSTPLPLPDTDSSPPQLNASSIPLVLMGIFFLLMFVCCCFVWIKCRLCDFVCVPKDEAEASAETAVCVPIPVCVIVLQETPV